MRVTTRPVRKRGRKGGVRQRLRRMKYKPPLPSIILANVRSLKGLKMDELRANATHLNEYRDACMMAFTETWFDNSVSDRGTFVDGFGCPTRLDRDRKATGKEKGGGVCLYVNERWCKTVMVREQLCTPDIELLSVSLRPLYLPREFPQLFVTVVYIHPKANVNRAAQHICDVTQKLDSLSPDAPKFVLGDFNQCKPKKCLPTYHQYVTCPTCMDRTIDLCYGSVPNAYRSIAKPPIGDADHNTVHLVPIYKSLLKRAKCVERQVKVWNEDSTARLQGCFDCTDWDVFRNSCSSLDELTDVVTSYVSFCVDTVIPVKKCKVFPNNKPWVSKQLKYALNEKKRVYFQGDLAERKGIQRTVKSEIRKARESYKHKIEMKFQTGDMRAVWDKT